MRILGVFAKIRAQFTQSLLAVARDERYFGREFAIRSSTSA